MVVGYDQRQGLTLTLTLTCVWCYIRLWVWFHMGVSVGARNLLIDQDEAARSAGAG